MMLTLPITLLLLLFSSFGDPCFVIRPSPWKSRGRNVTSTPNVSRPSRPTVQWPTDRIQRDADEFRGRMSLSPSDFCLPFVIPGTYAETGRVVGQGAIGD